MRWERISSLSRRGKREDFVEAYIMANDPAGRNKAQPGIMKSQINAVERGLRAFQRLDRAGAPMAVPLGTFHMLYPELFLPCALADEQATLTPVPVDQTIQPLQGWREQARMVEDRYQRASRGCTRSRSPTGDEDQRPDLVSTYTYVVSSLTHVR
jgi:hypothetical protein